MRLRTLVRPREVPITSPQDRTGRLRADSRRREAPAAVLDRRPASTGDPISAGSGTLPWWPTSFVGRLGEMAQVRQLLRRSRLVTVTGPGGVGKTRLAVRVASQMRERFAGGCIFVDLSLLGGPERLDAALPAMLGAGPSGAASGLDAAAALLGDRRVLLILDSCEHVLDDCARVARLLMERCPRIELLTTSREPLRVDGETVLSLSPLEAPEAVRLFVERASDRHPGFADAAPRADVARLCARLDTLPLAIELAAARVGYLSVTEIEAHLDRRFDLLEGGTSDRPSRHQTLRATIEWSFELLDPEERLLFRRLAVMAGGFDLRAAEAIGGTGTLSVLGRLVDKSMVVATPDAGATRYRMLETVRAYAQERLVEAAEDEMARREHFAYIAALAEAAYERRMTTGSDAGIITLAVDLDNLRAALEWAETADPFGALRLAGAMREIWRRRGVTEGRRWLTRFLAANPDPTPERARALLADGHLAISQRAYADARRALLDSLAISSLAGDEIGQAWATYYLGVSESLAGEYGEARTRLEEALQQFEILGSAFGRCRAVGNLGQLLVVTDADRDEASHLLNEELALAGALDEPWSQGHAHCFLAALALRAGNTNEAAHRALRAVELFVPGGDAVMVGHALVRLGRALARTDPRRAVTLVTAASSLESRLGARLGAPEEAIAQETRSVAARLIGAPAVERAARAAREIDLTDVVALARGTYRSVRQRGDLTPREAEVAGLVAEGRTNRDVASRLQLSERTVENHVLHACTKLGLENRTQLATWARDAGWAPNTEVAE